ncbi:shugoshin 1-like [Heteronotia binoei]|uniref:shugoshin 1-like n=1 Tax=Heteronotia binoei TaxID=13085 RepID=UPI002930BB48|nr:shugoshin 1-like [Heteronotia binoei]
MKNITCRATYKINQLNYCEIENGQDLRRNLKELGSNECRPDCQKNQGKNIMKSRNNSREVNLHCNLTAEITTHTLDVLSTKQVNEVLSQDNKRKIFAKASRKTCIIPRDSLKQKKIVKQNLHDENVPHVDITYKKAEKVQKTLDVHSVTPTCSLKEAESGDDTFKRIDSIQKPRRKTYVVCSSNQDKSKECIISNSAETATEVHNIHKTISFQKNAEDFQRTNQEKNERTPTEKRDVTCKESCKIPDFGNKALEDLTNISILCLPKSKKGLEENFIPATRRRRTTVCYREPKMNTKLRRGDEFTDTGFLHSAVSKVNIKQSFKSKSRLL